MPHRAHHTASYLTRHGCEACARPIRTRSDRHQLHLDSIVKRNTTAETRVAGGLRAFLSIFHAPLHVARNFNEKNGE